MWWKKANKPLLLMVAVLCFGWGHVLGEPTETREWEWIIIHHSATRVGSAEVFDAAHRSRGMINGLAYHFVIDNGTDGKPDGFIETGARWINQMHGGHCRQAYINEHGIGICLVGNFSVDQPTSKQLDSLALLIRGLQEQFHIPNDHVLGHGEVIGEFSECPGSQFPWDSISQNVEDCMDRHRETHPTVTNGFVILRKMELLSGKRAPECRYQLDVYAAEP